MGFLSIFLIITIVANLVISIFVYKNNPHSASNIILGILGLLITAWLIVLYFTQKPGSADEYLFWARTSILLAAPMSMSFFLLADTLPQNTLRISKPHLVAVLLTTAAVMILNLSPFTFIKAEMVGSSYQVQTGIGMMPFGLLSTFFSVGAVYLLFKKAKKASGREKDQFRFVNVGILLMLGLIITTIFIPIVFFKNTSFVIFAPIYTAIFLSMTGYAIVKERLLDIRAILARAVAFLIFISIAAAVYILVLFGVIQNILKLQIDFFIAITALILALIASLTFQPVFILLRKFTNKLFYKDLYDSEKLLSKLTHTMAQNIDLTSMATSILNLISNEMGLSKAAFIIMGNNNKISESFSYGYKKTNLDSKKFTKFLPKYLNSKPNLIFEELPENTIKKYFREFDISISIQIKVKNVIVAILILGPKLSGEIYDSRDINFLNLFASESGIAIQNAESYEQIKKFNVVLEKRVEERTRELQKSQQSELAKAKDIARLKDEFVFIASHELRTPVTAIRGFLEMVSEESKTFPANVQENLGYMAAASEHLNQLINDLLEISRSEAGAMKVTVQPSDIIPIIQSIIQEVLPQANKGNIKVSLNVDPKIKNAFALVDDKKIKEVMMNLLSNSIKYNRDNGYVDIKVTSTLKQLSIQVKDNGFGISKDQQSRIFEKFFRASNPKTGQVLGTGLGLFITRMLVEKMGGKISFTSVENKGTTFSILLPKAPVKAVKAA